MILYAILGLLFIVTIVLTVLSAKKDWHWLNPLLLIFIFIAGSAGMIGMAKTLDARQKVLKKIGKLDKDIIAASDQVQDITYGSPDSTEYGPKSLRGLDQKLELLKLGRGRSWKNGRVKFVNGTIEFTFASEQQEVENENLSLENIELFAFEDQPCVPLDENGQKYTTEDGQPATKLTPVRFIGKVLVTSQTKTSLTLVQSVPVANFDEFFDPKAPSWTLFERMPSDRHQIIRELYRGDKGDGFDIAAYRQWLATNFFQPNFVSMDPASAEYERLIDSFAFDGLSKGKIDAWVDNAQGRVSPRFEPDTTEMFVLYEFSGDSNESYTVDDKTGKLDTDGTFTVLGHAVDPLLQLSPGAESRDVKFKKGDRVEVDLATAQGYQRADGTIVPPFAQREPNVKEIDRFFRRELIDFPYEMTKLYNQQSQTQTDQQRLASNNQIQDTTLEFLKKQEQERTRLRVAFENDNKLLQNDIDQITEFLAQLDMRVSENSRKIEMLKQQLEETHMNINVRSGQ